MSSVTTSTRGTSHSRLDWEDIHRRLEAAQLAIGQARAPDPGEIKKVLRARARALARELQSAEAREDAIEVIEFVLAYERYAFESIFVREVYPLKALTPLPCTPPYVAGIVNIRGQIVSVLDIRKFFDLPQKGLTDLNKVIVLRSDSAEFGVLADVIIASRTIPASELQASLPTLTGIRNEYLRGVTADRLVILDAGKLVTDERLIVHEEVVTAPGEENVHVSAR